MGRRSSDKLSRDNEFYTKMISESPNKIWYLTTNGKAYTVSKKTGAKHILKCDTLRGTVRVPIESLHSMQLKRLVWRTFKGELSHKQCVIVKDHDERNCALSNLELMDFKNIPSLKKKPVILNGIEYPSVREASKAVPCSKASMLNYLNGKTKGKSCLEGLDIHYKSKEGNGK